MLIALMGSVLLICFFTGNGPSVEVLAVFGLAGILAGLLQYRAISQHPSKFQTAITALQVRAVLISCGSGKASIALLWLAGIALILLLMYGGDHATIQTIVGSYAIFSFARELASLPALFLLSRGKNHA
ncbi:MAG: hypothetical protein FWF20_09170 [Betaproteobacteria bacterium]|nr:hypothetical protein [Betaproteobacteria bacterium]